MVLKVTHLKSTGGSICNYLANGLDESDESEATAKYFQSSPATKWSGEFAKELNLSGSVDPDILSQLLEGNLPNGESVKSQPNRRLGEDFTFSAPKSVSIASLAWQDDRITEAHDAAVEDTLRWITKNMIYARRGKGGETREYAPTVLFATHRHVDSRPVVLPDGRIFVSPQLHSHCILPNICRRRSDGTLGGVQVEFGEGSGFRLLADSLYQSNLAERLRAMGIGLRESKNGFELKDISDEMIERWSPRTAQINQELANQGLNRASSTSGQRQAANLKTREHKGNYTALELRALWSTVQHPSSYTAPEVTPPGNVDFAVQNTVSDIEERLAVVPTHLLQARAILSTCAHHDASEVQEALRSNETLINLNNGQHVTTIQSVHDEAFIQSIGQPRENVPALVNNDAVQLWLSYREQRQGFRYSMDQLRALKFIARDQNKIALCVGSAGSGKTTAMQAVSELASQGYEVVGLGPSHTSTNALRESVGDRVWTVSRWISNPPPLSQKPRYLIVDESGMIGTHDLAALLRTLGPNDRALLVGDPKQLGPIASGQPFAQLLEKYPHATISEIRRQVDEEQRAMVSAFARGDARSGANALMKFVMETDDYQQTIDRAASAYMAAQGHGSTVALASRRQTVRDLSAAIRQKMQTAGQLTPDLCTIETAQNVTVTKAAMRRRPTYTIGTKLKSPKRKIYEVTVPPVLIDGQPVVTVTSESGKTELYRLDDLADEDWQIFTLESLSIAQSDQILITDTVPATKANGERITLRNVTGN
jgi:conjugative relaxase domain, TrwC/TraI family